MKNPRYGFGAIGQTAPVHVTNNRIGMKGTDISKGPPRERYYPLQNIHYPAQVRIDNASGKTLNQIRNTRPLIV